MEEFRKELFERCLKMSKKLRKLPLRNNVVKTTLHELWEALGNSEYHTVYTLLKYLKDLHKHQVLKMHAKKQAKERVLEEQQARLATLREREENIVRVLSETMNLLRS